MAGHFYSSDSDSIQSCHEGELRFEARDKAKSQDREEGKVSCGQMTESINSIAQQVQLTFNKMNKEFDDIGLSKKQKINKQKELLESLVIEMRRSLEAAEQEKRQLKSNCIALQKNIFKILRVFSKNGYKPSSRKQSNDDDSEVSEETYTEINEIFTNEEEFNDVMKAIPDEYTKHYLLQKISTPYNDTRSYLALISRLLSKEYFSRLLTFLRTVLLLKESAEEIDFYSEENESAEQSSILFSKSLPSIEQCKICIHELEKVSLKESNIDTICKVVSKILDANNFNNLSKSFLNRIQYQIKLVEVEKEKKFDLAIERANNILDLWRSLYDYQDNEESESIQFDAKIVKCSEGDVSEIGLTLNSLRYLNTTYEKLQQERESRKVEIKKLLEKCDFIFHQLKESPEVVEKFYQTYKSSLSLAKMKQLEIEVKRLEEKKKHFMKDIIDFLKLDIEKLWQKLFFADEQKYKFKAYWSEEYNDDILLKLETELSGLLNLADEFADMFDKIGQYNALLSDKQSLDDASKNPARLLARNSGAILLKEEKLRKNIKRRFPKVCVDLKNYLIDFGKATKSIIKNEEYHSLLQQLEAENFRPLDRYNVSRRLSPVKKVSPMKKTSPTKTFVPNKKTSPIREHTHFTHSTSGSVISRKVQSAVRKPIRIIRKSPMSYSVSRAHARQPHNIDYFNVEADSPTNNRSKRARKLNGTTHNHFPKLSFTEKSNLTKPLFSPKMSPSPRTAKSPSVKYSVPLDSFQIRISPVGQKAPVSRKRKSDEMENGIENQIIEPGNVFLMDKEEDKENEYLQPKNEKEENYDIQSSHTTLDTVKLREAEELGPIPYQGHKKVGSRKKSVLRESNVFNDSMGDDSMYRNWKDRRLRQLRYQDILSQNEEF